LIVHVDAPGFRFSFRLIRKEQKISLKASSIIQICDLDWLIDGEASTGSAFEESHF